MDDEQKKELEAEQAATQEIKEDEVRAAIVAEFGFDEVDDAERIDKLTKKEVENRQKLSKAIGQKRNYRTKLEEATKVPKPPTEVEKPATEDIGKIVSQELEKRDLDSLEYSDDLKKEIQRVATVQGVSIKQAARDPYILHKIDEWKKEQTAEEAAITRTNRSSGNKKTFSVDTPPDSDMSTPEGRKEWQEYTEWMKKQGK